MSMPAPGDLAPDFEGRTQSGETLRLSDLRGRPVALFVYPKDDTPGCTRQACNLRDHTAALEAAGVAVVGLSPDDEAAHARFAGKYALPFPLVADPEKTILGAYGVWGEKTLYGRLFLGVKRTTFLIGPDGRVVDVIRRPDVDRHAEEVLARFRKAGVVA
jgi:peroxiredoxin Q/BCP